MSMGTIPPFYSLGGGGGFGITGSPASGWTFSKTAETGVAETIATWSVSDDATSRIIFENATSTNALFTPVIRRISASTTSIVDIYQITAGQDSGSNPVHSFRSRLSTNSSVSVRPLFWWMNNTGGPAMALSAAGGLSLTLGSTPSFTLGVSGTAITQMRVYSQALDPASVAANTTAEQTFTVTGLATTDKVFVNKPSNTAGLGIVNARVSAVDTLAITFGNFTAAPIDAASETYTITAIRS